jgi:ribosome biogenesis GTPase A
MAIQWFPGHMNKARREVKERMSRVDMVIEVLDARLPFSSINPMVEQLRASRPALKILNKADLADDQVTQAWVQYFTHQVNTKVLVLSSQNKITEVKRLPQICQSLVPHRVGVDKPVRAMILGVPNAGKSTLLNLLLQRKIAKVADTPGVTKSQQRVELASGMVLYDTPGLMWPKIENEASGFRLALSGAIGINAYDIEEVAWFALETLRIHYPNLLMTRYGLSELAQDTQTLIEQIGRQRKALLAGNKIDYIRTAEVIVHDFRQGHIGKISLETPNDFI